MWKFIKRVLLGLPEDETDPKNETAVENSSQTDNICPLKVNEGWPMRYSHIRPLTPII